MKAKEEKRARFNELMNEWVSRQGLWFQLRHAADGQTILARLARLGLRVALLLVVVALVFWIYLVRRVGSEGFRDSLQASIESTLCGSACELGALHKERSAVSIASISVEGTEKSFFHTLKARQVSLKMGLTDGWVGKWDGGGISIDHLEAFVKAGDGDDTVASDAFNSLFVEHPGFSYEWIESDNTDIRWGYSENNQGSIKGSQMSADRVGSGWRLVFKGGTFSQNWLRDLKIKNMVVLCDQQGVHIKEAELLSGAGSLSFQVDFGSGGQPQAVGVMTLDSMPVKAMLPARFHDWIGGKVSGKGEISGSTNSQEGIVMDIDLSLEGDDVLVLRDTVPLLSALSVVDLYNSYRKVSFSEGGCHIRTGGNRLGVTKIDLRADDLLHLAGQLVVRTPTDEEIAEALNIKDVQVVRDLFEKNWKIDDELVTLAEGESSVAEAAKGVGEVVRGASNASSDQSADAIRETSILAEQRVRRFDGVVRVGLKHDAFDKSPRLIEEYPVDTATGRIWLDAPLKGRLQTLTLSLAERLYVLGRNRR